MENSQIVGPIRVSENGRYFVDQDGRPFFWLGDTQWELFRSFTFAEAETILEDRREKGFNAIQVMITGVGNGTKPDVADRKPWVNDDPATPNEEYFKNVDAVLKMGLQKGLIFVLGVYHQTQVSYITTANARTYAKWIALRYKDTPNIIWTMYPKAEQEFVPVMRELAAGLQEGDGGAHIISVHPDPSPASSGFIHSESWLACNMIQTWAYYDKIYSMVTEDYNRIPAKPVVMAEGAYEGGPEYGFPVTPLMVRKQAYWSYLSGGFHSYGHNDNWRLPSRWRESLDAPGAAQMRVLKDIFTARQWWKLIPDQSIFAEGSTDTMLRIAARSESGDWCMIYFGESATASINMSKAISGNSAAASWIDPRTGAQAKIGEFANTGIRSFSTPDGWEDAVLILESI